MLRWIIWAGLALAVSAAPAAAQDARALAALKARIQSGELANVHAVLVVKDGRTLAEWYFPGRDERRGRPLGRVEFGPGTQHDIRSVSKSVVGLLAGAAVADGSIRSLETPVLDYFPELRRLRTPQKAQIRLKHLLTMTSGLAWDEETRPYGTLGNSETRMDVAFDRYAFVLSRKVEAPPGRRYRYSGGDVALMAEVIERATGQRLDAYAQQKLFAPLGITQQTWLKDLRGTPIAASGLRMTPRDMAKVGQLVLDRGRWQGRQVIPAAWVAAAVTPHAQMSADAACGQKYGYFWRYNPGCLTRPATPFYAAVGNGGQRIWVVPSRRTVVVMTAGNYNKKTQGMVTDKVLQGVLAAVP